MSNEDCIIQLLTAILKELKTLNDKVISRINTQTIINDIDTSLTTERRIDIMRELGIKKANSVYIIATGGGFTFGTNGGKKTTAFNDLSKDDEDIYTIEIIGSGTSGTASIEIGAYIPK